MAELKRGRYRPGLEAFARKIGAHPVEVLLGPGVIVQSTGRSRVGMGRAEDPRWREASGAAQWLVTATDGATWIEIGRDGIVRRGEFLEGR